MTSKPSASRRELLKAGFAVAAATLVPRAALAQAPLLTRPVPATGVRLPIVGIGTNRFRSGDAAWTARLRDTLAAFARLGGKVVDPAPSSRDSRQALGPLRDTPLH